LRQDPEEAFVGAVEIAQALQPAAAVLREMGFDLPEPANR